MLAVHTDRLYPYALGFILDLFFLGDVRKSWVSLLRSIVCHLWTGKFYSVVFYYGCVFFLCSLAFSLQPGGTLLRAVTFRQDSPIANNDIKLLRFCCFWNKAWKFRFHFGSLSLGLKCRYLGLCCFGLYFYGARCEIARVPLFKKKIMPV